MFDREELDRWEAEDAARDELRRRNATSQGRFGLRLERFRDRHGRTKGTLLHAFWWFVHNVPVHIMIGMCPVGWTFRLHDITSDRLNMRER